MINLLYIVGEPATGKSTLMRHLMIRHFKGLSMTERWGKVPCLVFEDAKVCVLGKYDDETFSGTDRLSMSIILEIEAMLKERMVQPHMSGWTIIGEGDRLFNARFFDFLAEQKIPHSIIGLVAGHDTKEQRHAKRDNQDASWLRGRRTKYFNLLKKYQWPELPNNDLQELEENAEVIMVQIDKLKQKSIMRDLGY